MIARLSLIIPLIIFLAWWICGFKAWRRIVRKTSNFTLLDSLFGIVIGLAGPLLLLFLVKDASEVVIEEKLEDQKESGKEEGSDHGFTLIELLIVIAIIGILIITIPEFVKKYSKRQDNQQQIEAVITDQL
ncbi:prepilin-type N-terminal cleavage/methylation domain-containing protein [Candidatus Pacearchaeota archaeon]|nr:prepilin-type N-terminal cleavage/methylation domain-containing protein [Candidatus Pacearchaeota archaeon]